MIKKNFVLVSIFSLKILTPFYYYIEDDIVNDLRGFRCIIELNNHFYCGIILSQNNKLENINEKRIKPVLKIIDNTPYLNEEILKVALWMEDYYFTPLGKILSVLCPGGTNLKVKTIYKVLNSNIKKNNKLFTLENNEYSINELLKTLDCSKKFINDLIKTNFLKKDYQIVSSKKYYDKNHFTITVNEHETKDLTSKELETITTFKNADVVYEKNQFDSLFSKYIINKLKKKNLITVNYAEPTTIRTNKNNSENGKDLILTNEQENVFNSIKENIIKNKFKSFLIFGVTGSGKTEIYIRLIKEVLKLNKTAIVIVPEISLTPQTLYNFSVNFNEDRIAVIHSRLNDRQRFTAWEKIKSDDVDIVIGVRSAIFAPLKNLGLIVVDEEHEDTYKNFEMPTYNARDIAVLRCKFNNAVTVLGSATPSIDTYYNSLNKKYSLFLLKDRPFQTKLPDIEVVDLNKVSFMEKQNLLSQNLLKEMKEVLSAGKQVMLFLNRRGYSNIVLCKDCGYTFSCKNCDIALTYHKTNKVLNCHYCGYAINRFNICPDCKSKDLLKIGSGTQKITEIITKRFYNKTVYRVDMDTMRFKDSYETFFDKISKKEVDIIIGTQIITKGHNFPDIGLVGIVCADLSLNFPDYRSCEKTFSLIMQVAGRTGRSEKDAGKVIIQTFSPSHYAIKSIVNYEYNTFYKTEFNIRNKYLYPPYVKLMLIEFKGAIEKKVFDDAITLKKQINSTKIKNNIILLGPAPGVISKIKNLYYYKILIKSKDIKFFHFIFQKFLKKNNFYSNIRVEI